MTRPIVLAAMIVAVLPLAGCFQSAVDPLAPPDREAQLLGTWVSESDGMTVTFAEKGRYLAQAPGGEEAIEGNYRVDGAGVVMSNDPTESVCPAETGSYTFVARKVSGVSFFAQELKGRFMLVDDSCETRVASMQEAYIKR